MRTLIHITKTAAVLGTAAILGGCAFGQQQSYSDAPASMQSVSSAGSVAVGVHDQRPYVITGNKTDRFVGLQRGGFGNPFDVTTASGGPFADEFRDGIVRALKARGISAVPVTIAVPDQGSVATQKLIDAKARRSALLTMREWKSDTMYATDMHYDVTLTILDSAGKQLAASTIKGKDNIGYQGLSPKEGIAKATAAKIDQLFDDEQVRAALK